MGNMERATEFVVFCIENTARRLGVSGTEVFRSMDGAGGIGGFLYPSYETLHTQSKDYIVDEVLSYMAEKGIKVAELPKCSEFSRSPLINDTLLQMKYARVVSLLAKRLVISEEDALGLFYGSETYRELSDLRNGLQNMGDLYLADSVILENSESSGLASELEKGRRQYREGDTVTCATKKELDKFLKKL